MGDVKEKFEKMDPQWKQTWVDALRSGLFGQTQYALYGSAPDAYCCLGVLEEISSADPGSRPGGAVLNYTTRKLTGLVRRAQSALVERNDNLGWSFKQIANWIERNL